MNEYTRDQRMKYKSDSHVRHKGRYVGESYYNQLVLHD